MSRKSRLACALSRRDAPCGLSLTRHDALRPAEPTSSFPRWPIRKKSSHEYASADPGHDRPPAFRTRPHRAPDRRPRSSGILDRMDWVARQTESQLRMRCRICTYLPIPVCCISFSCLAVFSIIIDIIIYMIRVRLNTRIVKDNVAQTLGHDSHVAEDSRAERRSLAGARVYARETFA